MASMTNKVIEKINNLEVLSTTLILATDTTPDWPSEK